MLVYAKKNISGYYKPVAKVDDEHESPAECDTVIIPIKEYNKIQETVKELTERLDNMHSRYEKECAKMEGRIQNLQDTQIRTNLERAAIKEQCDKTVLILRGKLAEAQAENDHQSKLTNSLLRINKERNNADRELPDKKSRSGYIFLSSSEKELRYTPFNGYTQKSVPVWDTSIQTPFSIDIPADTARRQSIKDIRNLGIDKKMGINIEYFNGYQEMIKDSKFMKKVNKNTNVWLGISLRADYRAGYWVIILQHTQAPSVLPEDLLPPKTPCKAPSKGNNKGGAKPKEQKNKPQRVEDKP